MLKLKKNLNKDDVLDLVKKDNSIEYTQEDIDFYNEYFKDENVIEIHMSLKFILIISRLLMFSMFVIALLSIVSNPIWYILGLLLFTVGLMGGFVTMTILITQCKGFKNFLTGLKTLRKLKNLKEAKFNNHYYLKNRVEIKLKKEKIEIDESILNKVIKNYQKDISFKELVDSEFSKEDIINEYEVLKKYANN